MVKRFVIAFVLVALIAGGLVGFNIFRDRAIEQYFANAPQQTITVSAVRVEKGSWTPVIEAIGTVKAADGVDLTVETAGVVREINFDTNQRVEKGELLVQLDDAAERADLQAAQAQARLDEQALERARELQERGVGSSVSVDNARAAASASRAQVAKLEAILDQKQLRAPFSGVIGLPRVDIGQYVSPGTVVATLQDIDTMHVDFTVPERERDRLKVGQRVRLGTTEEDLGFTGSIIGIDPKIDPATRLVSVRAVIDNSDRRLSPGQFARVQVVLPEEEGVIWLPQTAIVTSLYGDYVYEIVAAGRQSSEQGSDSTPARSGEAVAAPSGQGDEGDRLVIKQVFVKTGRRSGGRVEIVKGLSPGARVVSAGQNRLSSGMAVRIDNTINPDGGERLAVGG